MAAGCPLIISDRTPWVNLEQKNVGWEIPLENPAKWIEIINKTIEMSESEYRQLSDSAKNFVSGWLEDDEIEKDTISVLEFSLSNTLTQIA